MENFYWLKIILWRTSHCFYRHYHSGSGFASSHHSTPTLLLLAWSEVRIAHFQWSFSFLWYWPCHVLRLFLCQRSCVRQTLRCFLGLPSHLRCYEATMSYYHGVNAPQAGKIRLRSHACCWSESSADTSRCKDESSTLCRKPSSPRQSSFSPTSVY